MRSLLYVGPRPFLRYSSLNFFIHPRIETAVGSKSFGGVGPLLMVLKMELKKFMVAQAGAAAEDRAGR